MELDRTVILSNVGVDRADAVLGAGTAQHFTGTSQKSRATAPRNNVIAGHQAGGFCHQTPRRMRADAGTRSQNMPFCSPL